MTREVPIEYKVNRAANSPDTQRHQLNRILEDIREKLESAGLSGDYVTQQELEAALAGLDLGGKVDVVVGGVAISVNNSNPAAPVVSVDISGLVSTDVGNTLTVGTDGGLFTSGGGGGGGSTGIIFADFEASPGFLVPPISQGISVAYNYEITGWRITTGGPLGSCQFDILRQTSLGGSATSIVGSAPPILSAASYNESTTLTGWTTTGDYQDFLTIQLTVSGGLQKVRIELMVDKV